MLPEKLIEQYVTVPDSRVKLTALTGDTDIQYLKVYQRVVEVACTAGTLDLRLPDVAAAKGMLYSITALNGATKTVTVNEKASGNSYDYPSAPALNADLDRVLMQSDGKRWWIVTDQYT
jgi:hypothetical protein